MQANLQRQLQPMQQHSFWEVQKGKTKRKKTPGCEPLDEGVIQTTNQFTVLSDSDNEDGVDSEVDVSSKVDNCTIHLMSKSNGKSINKLRDEQTGKPDEVEPSHSGLIEDDNMQSTTPTKRSRPRVAILGDSMLKHLNPRKLQNGLNHRITIKTFPGATTDDMVHYVQPTLKTRPERIILHIGTNDLKSKFPDILAQSVAGLGEAIKRGNKDIKLTFSSIIIRNDEAGIAEKVTCYNELLNKLCAKHNWDVIDNKNIDRFHLNNYGTHLSKKGSGALAKNIKNYLANT